MKIEKKEDCPGLYMDPALELGCSSSQEVPAPLDKSSGKVLGSQYDDTASSKGESSGGSKDHSSCVEESKQVGFCQNGLLLRSVLVKGKETHPLPSLSPTPQPPTPTPNWGAFPHPPTKNNKKTDTHDPCQKDSAFFCILFGFCKWWCQQATAVYANVTVLHAVNVQ